MWPFRRKTWTEKQKKYRRLCRLDEKETEQMINWLEMNMHPIKLNKQESERFEQEMTTPAQPNEALKRAVERFKEGVATHVPTDPDEAKEGASTGLPEVLAGEFVGSGDPKGDNCCTEPRCPCHE